MAAKATLAKNMNEFVLAFLREQNIEDITGIWKRDYEQDFINIANPPKIVDTNPDRPTKHTDYQLYCADHREEVVAAHPEAKNSEITKIMGQQWKALKEDKSAKAKKQVAEYQKHAKAEKAAYEKAMESYEAPEEYKKVRKPRKAKLNLDPNRPTKRNSFVIYCADNRAAVKEDNPDAKPAEITKLLAADWREHKEEESEIYKEYQEKAEAEKQAYADAMEGYETPDGYDAPAPRKARAKAPAKAKAAKGKARQKDPNRPKKLTAYQLFCRDRRPELKDEVEAKEIAKVMGAEWSQHKEEADDIFQHYSQLGEEEKERWAAEMAAYQAEGDAL